MNWDELGPFFIVGALALLILGGMVLGVLRFGSWAGLMFGARVLATCGEVETQPGPGVDRHIRVYRLSSPDPDRAIGLAITTSTRTRWHRAYLTVSVGGAQKLAVLLAAATARD